MKRTAKVTWVGNLKRGRGNISLESGAIKALPYSFSQRFEGESGTNPEELIGAAYASCFSMALSGELEKRGHIADKLEVTSEVHLDKTSSGWKIPQIHLRLVASIPGVGAKEIDEIASITKDTCPVGKILNTHTSLEIHVLNQESVAPEAMI